MKWSDLGRSRNLEDRRGGGGGFNMGGMGMGGLGLGGVVIVIVIAFATGQNPLSLLERVQGSGVEQTAAPAAPVNDPAEEREVRFVSFVLDTTQAFWHHAIPDYHDATLVLFRDQTPTSCGTGDAASGPFYCPGDEKVYIDLGFYDELKSRFGAPGEFAQAYVLAHEIGHHVQKILGIEAQTRQAMEQNRGGAKQLSVQLELQADCFAGAWAHEASQEGIVQANDIQDGLNAAAAVGDDRLQRMAGRSVQPETWTHGSSEQRMAAFMKGYTGGTVEACR